MNKILLLLQLSTQSKRRRSKNTATDNQKKIMNKYFQPGLENLTSLAKCQLKLYTVKFLAPSLGLKLRLKRSILKTKNILHLNLDTSLPRQNVNAIYVIFWMNSVKMWHFFLYKLQEGQQTMFRESNIQRR